ncbi:hypothetical protein KsCSTR_34320 [Candidatus Kuenenia stuttgartiensis]|uniref:Uncharacterized protein n=1 Tax=Kuenenia stuttgartiensis TaxID=174633 RepID=Q1Q474_KUEST|nr:hypothetical protein KsCSTR_34320 [Candidatus Kuenenia stuttgartiensis]CAJ74810.1 unknown protein [Candidatus Kuenenia stuttgartiensis]
MLHLAFNVVPEYYCLCLRHHCLLGKMIEKQHTIYNKLHVKHTSLGRKHIKSPMKTQRCSAKK